MEGAHPVRGLGAGRWPRGLVPAGIILATGGAFLGRAARGHPVVARPLPVRQAASAPITTRRYSASATIFLPPRTTRSAPRVTALSPP